MEENEVRKAQENDKIVEECMKSENVPMVVERYTWLERVAHMVHLLSLFILIITGFKIYAGWDFMQYHNALALHMIAAGVFLAVNWIVVPYNIVSSECVRCFARWGTGRTCRCVAHIAHRYVFGPADFKRLKQILRNFIGKAAYPAFTVYNTDEKRYEDTLHPLMQLLLFFEGCAILLVALSGIVLYNPNWTFSGLPVGLWILSAGEFIAPVFAMSAMGFLRTLHLLMAYWFIFELIVHVGILEFDPKVWKYYKAIFVTGKEDLSDGVYVELTGNK